METGTVTIFLMGTFDRQTVTSAWSSSDDTTTSPAATAIAILRAVQPAGCPSDEVASANRFVFC